MKYFKSLICLLAICAITLSPFPPFMVFANTTLPHVGQSTQMRGLWVTSAYNLDWPSRQGLTPAQHRAEIDDILTRAANQGINAVFVQVRPAGDALYRSDIFPWSHLLTGTQGVAPANNFDPLAYWIEAAHGKGIEVHAWINPYRVTFPNQNITNPAQLAASHPARLDPSLVIAYGTSLFFDPGNPAARQLIVDGAAELLRNYDIDGIHLDDYFYPSRNFPDGASFARYGGGMDRHDWRRENVNALVRELQAITHEINPDASFGVSPFAIWRNNDADPRGSATQGMESYFTQYADTRRWVLEGWVDYIVPQIYWVEGNAAACYEAVLSWWEDLVKDTDVRLYIGLAPYREVSRLTDPRFSAWSAGDIVRQLERNARSPVVQGSIFFRERFMRSDVGNAIGQFYARHLPGQVPTRPQPGGQNQPPANAPPTVPPLTIPPLTPPATNVPTLTIPPPPTLVIPPTDTVPRLPIPTPPMPAPANPAMDRLLVAQPSRAEFTVTDAAGFWFYGSAVPDVPLYVNNQRITDRTGEGFFSIFMPLERGRNTFTFTQAGQADVSRVIINNAPAAARPPATMPFGIENAFPTANEWARQGSTITLRATAPAGATVTAEFAGETIELTQTNTNLASTASSFVAAQFTASVTLNAEGTPSAITNLGSPVYTMTLGDQTRTTAANGVIRQLGAEAPFFVEITGDNPWVFPGATTTGGAGWAMQQGQVDRVAAISGDWVRLGSGGWLQREHVRTWEDPAFATSPVLSAGRYTAGPHADVITWAAQLHTAIQGEFDGRRLIITMGIDSVLPTIEHVPEDTLFSDIRIGTHNGAPAYFMTLGEGESLEGFYTAYENGELRLYLRRRRPLTPGNYPFAGFTFIIDAGHGGTDPGASGPMGPPMSEAVIALAQANLITAQLEALGANVVRIRDTDVFYTLQQRVDISRATNPDMFISLHTNATAETTNATNIRGFTVWFRNENSRPAAETFLDVMHNVNPDTNRSRGVNQANFFVCRPMWAPHILLEASFTNNIHDFSWLINPRRQEEYARAVVNALLAYYR